MGLPAVGDSARRQIPVVREMVQLHADGQQGDKGTARERCQQKQAASVTLGARTLDNDVTGTAITNEITEGISFFETGDSEFAKWNNVMYVKLTRQILITRGNYGL